MYSAPARKRKLRRWILPILLTTLLLASLAFVSWASTPLGPAPAALAALSSDADVQVAQQSDWIAFTPTGPAPTTGFILYPGGRVDYRSYAPIANALAAQGFLVAIPAMPLSLAVFAPDAAAAIIAAYPWIEHWALGGHSLGGAMAARFAFTHPDLAQGLALWASYPAETDDLSQSGLRVLSIYGTEDRVAAAGVIAASRTRLPADTQWIEIAGGNHAQFGAYGIQPGDGIPTISAEAQWQQTILATSTLLHELHDEVMK